MHTFVLIHGGWHGGWCWKRVAKLLRQDGHDVFTPTLTGLCERSHLLTDDVGLKTHVDDVVNLLKWESLAGVVLVGVVLNAVCSPEYTINALRIIKQSAEQAGRDFSNFEVAQIINCSIEDDHKKALDAVRWEVATKLDPVQISFIAAPKMRVGEPYIRKEDIPLFERAHAQGGMDGLIKTIPDSYVEGMTASGTPDEVKKRVQQYRDAGVKIPLLRPAAAHQTQRLLDLFAQ